MKALCLSFFILCWGSHFSQVDQLKRSSDRAREKIIPTENGRRTQLDFTTYVDPFIGTGGHGHTYPGAVAPFGMMQLSPDTRYQGWDACSGYHYSDSIIYGFSHTHLSGTGVEDLGDLLIVPQQGTCLTEPGYLSPQGYGSAFTHSNEHAEPGLYTVKLKKQAISVRLAASERAGIHEYTFTQKKGKKYILIDLVHRDEVLAAGINVRDKKTISGFRRSKSWAKNQQFFFYLESNIPCRKFKLINGNKLVLKYPARTKQIILKVGISAVDEDGAKKNLIEEIPGFELDAVHLLTKAKWNKELAKIHFTSPEPDVMRNFYTAQYHSYICPSVFSDVDGRFRGNDDQIHQSLSEKRYTTFSIWDTYRATHPLFTLTQRKRTEDFIASFLGIYQETGKLPVWELWGNETECMIGYHAVSIIYDAFTKGITNFNHELALEAMIATANKKEHGKDLYQRDQFLSSHLEPESVSKTLEYAFDDWNIGSFAKHLNEAEKAHVFSKRSFNYMNLYNPQTQFMQPRRSGIWVPGFNPSEVNFNFTEANSWQYSLYAPHDIRGLRQLIGGKDSLENWLDRLFTASSALDGRQQADITGLIGQYAHGNEPSHHMAYLYNYTHSPEKTQERVDEILREMYSPTPDGLSGNEDCGQMSSWYVFSSMGLYPVCPGSATYQFGRPLQETAGIHLENGKSFYIRTQNNSPQNKYIQEIMLNGEQYSKLYIDHNKIMNGGELLFVMGSQPNPHLDKYAREVIDNPSFPFPHDLVPLPYFTAVSESFKDSITCQISTLAFPNCNIKYTTDGSEPHFKSKTYTHPLVFTKTTTLKAKVFRTEEFNEERVYTHEQALSCTFKKLDPNIRLELVPNYANQYAAGGTNALLDGLLGGFDFRSGAWQGFEAVDAEGKLFFEQNKKVKQVTFRCLQDIKSWIFMPLEIQMAYSTDGINFQFLPDQKPQRQADEFGNFIEELTFNLPETTIKAIQFKVVNRKTCPEGHLGAGEKSWIFLDEIILKE